MIDVCVDFHKTRVILSVSHAVVAQSFVVINEIFFARFWLSNFHFLYSHH